MISHIYGKIIYKDNKKVIIDKQSIGFEVFLSLTDLNQIVIGEERDIFTFLFLGEKVMELYGFLTPEKLELFKILNHVSGVGPKTAMGLAVLGSLEKLKEALERGEIPNDVKGVGTKRLQKILLDITGKIEEVKKKPISKIKLKKDEIFDTLLSLGFNKQEVADTISQIPEEINGTKERLKAALKILGK